MSRPIAASSGGGLDHEIVLFDPAAGSTTTVARGSTVASASWGPDGEIVILRREATGPVLVVQRPDGSRRELNPEQPDVGNIQWGRSGWMAMDFSEPDHDPTGTLFLHPASGERSVLDGWLPLAWSPDGTQLLMAEAKEGKTLAVMELPDLTKTRNVGVSEVGTIWDAVWLPA
jgi:Tol biopolymer transport system component